MHPSHHAHTPMRRLNGQEGSHRNASAPLLFPFLGGTRAQGAGWWGCNGSAFANTAAFQTDVCMHTHIHKVVNRRPIISHLFLMSSQLDWRLIIGHWGDLLGVTPAAAHTHTCTYTCHFHLGFCVISSCHPLSSFCPSSSHHPLCFSFFHSFLINWCCLRYYLCHTNQINGRHSFLKGKLLKKMSLSRAVALRRISDLLPLAFFFLICGFFCF